MRTKFHMLHRLGMLRLAETPADGGGTTPAAPGEAPAATPAPKPAPPATTPPPAPPAPPASVEPKPGDGLPTDVDSLHKMIATLRAESGKERTTAKENAAKEATDELTQKLGKALGIINDGEAPTAEQLTAQATEAQAASKQAAIELAVYRTAPQHGGNPAALTDSRSFLTKVAGLDPTAEEFSTKVTEAAKAAVVENTSLKAAQVAGQSTVEHPAGGGPKFTQPASLNAAVDQAYATSP